MHSCSNSIIKVPLYLVATIEKKKLYRVIRQSWSLSLIRVGLNRQIFLLKFFFSWLLCGISFNLLSQSFHIYCAGFIWRGENWSTIEILTTEFTQHIFFFLHFVILFKAHKGIQGDGYENKSKFFKKKLRWNLSCFEKSSNRLFKLVSAVSWSSRRRWFDLKQRDEKGLKSGAFDWEK